MQKKVVVIGAGMGGLMLARVLNLHGITADVYEAESSIESRNQGGLLDIHEYNGQKAIKAGGLFEEFLRIVRPGEDAKRIVDKQAKILLEIPGGLAGASPEVDRGELRKLLLDSVPANSIHWNHKVTSVKTADNGKHVVTFTNGSEIACDLLVGADGAWSKVRSLVSKIKPIYTGTVFIGSFIFNGLLKHKASVDLIGKGTLIAPSPGKAIFAHQNANGSIGIYAALNKPEKWIHSLNLSATDSSLAVLKEEFKDWASELISLIAHSDASPVIRPIYSLPVDHQWKRVPGVTLIGDAAHLMSPFAGEGANLALYDGAELAQAIVANPDIWRLR